MASSPTATQNFVIQQQIVVNAPAPSAPGSGVVLNEVRPTLVTGGPVNDDSVKNLIRNGTANMPGYKYALKDEDLNDLVSFIKEKGFWDNDSPPLNPRFRALSN